jgi:hypothetical protein
MKYLKRYRLFEMNLLHPEPNESSSDVDKIDIENQN